MVRSTMWSKIAKNRPFFILAPMIDVTDAAFRAMFAKYGKPDVLFTEFVPADGLCSVGKDKLMHMLKFSENQRPIVAQIFGANPVNIKKAAILIAELGFDGLDINMGCPDRSVLKQGAGAALIKTPALAREIIRAAIEGVESVAKTKGSSRIPVSVKTRSGFNKVEIEEWIPELLKEDIAALTIHARTKKEMSAVPADWTLVKRVAEMVKVSGKNILVIGNGDVKDLVDGKQKAKETGADGIMIGRGAFGNPWLFDLEPPSQNASAGQRKKEISIKEKLTVMLEHTKLFEELLGEVKNFAVMKKHYKAYVSGWDGAKELRVKLMETNSYEEVERLVDSYLI